MSFRDNLQHLRATRGMTQEQLAMMVGVSRQSVTKWESERAYPEMDKLLKICQVFDCTIDDLVQGDLTTRAGEPKRAMPQEAGDSIGYEEHCRSHALRLAVSVGLFVGGSGVGMLVGALMQAMAASTNDEASSITIGVGVLIFVAAGLALLIPTTTGHNAFRREHPYVIDFYSAKERGKNERLRARELAAGISNVLLGAIVAMMLGDSFDNGSWQESLVMSLMMILIAIGVGVIVHAGALWDMTNIEKYNTEALCSLSQKEFESAMEDLDEGERRRMVRERQKSKATGTSCALVMLGATIIALSLLFVTKVYWFWAPWPIGGVTCGIIGTWVNRKD